MNPYSLNKSLTGDVLRASGKPSISQMRGWPKNGLHRLELMTSAVWYAAVSDKFDMFRDGDTPEEAIWNLKVALLDEVNIFKAQKAAEKVPGVRVRSFTSKELGQ